MLGTKPHRLLQEEVLWLRSTHTARLDRPCLEGSIRTAQAPCPRVAHVRFCVDQSPGLALSPPQCKAGPELSPGAVSAVQRASAPGPLHEPEHPREIMSQRKNPNLALNEPRGSPKTFTRRMGCCQTPAACVSVPLLLLMS